MKFCKQFGNNFKMTWLSFGELLQTFDQIMPPFLTKDFSAGKSWSLCWDKHIVWGIVFYKHISGLNNLKGM